MKIGVADYGLNVWDGGLFDLEERFRRLLEIGYDGAEKLRVNDASDLVTKAARIRRLGGDFAMVEARSADLTIEWTAAMGKRYVWTDVLGKKRDFETFCRQVEIQAEACRKWGIDVALHNHMGTLVETQAELEAFLEKCPNAKLVLDTAHLAAAEGGDPLKVVKQHVDRLAMVHVKDWFSTDPPAEHWGDRGYFVELGAGNIGLDNATIVKELAARGYDDWVCVEHDKHRRNPMEDLAVSREYLRKAGF